jgi:hypothetical protein
MNMSTGKGRGGKASKSTRCVLFRNPYPDWDPRLMALRSQPVTLLLFCGFCKTDLRVPHPTRFRVGWDKTRLKVKFHTVCTEISMIPPYAKNA